MLLALTSFSPHARATGVQSLELRGEITDESAETFIEAVRAAPPGDLRVDIDSPGGVIQAGDRIISALEDHQGRVTCVDTGTAASMAGIVFQSHGCDVRVMEQMALVHFHLPSGVVGGNVIEQHQQQLVLDAMRRAMYEVIAARAGVVTADAIMTRVVAGENVWLTAREALALGLADVVR
jgi:ATP-dependent Clp protease protease subunit